MQINRAQSGGAGARHVGGRLQNVELRSKSGGEIRFCDFERLVGPLDILRFGLKNIFRLLQVEKRASDFGGDRSARRFKRLHRRFAPGVRRLHSSLGREAVEEMPRPVEVARANNVPWIAVRQIDGVDYDVSLWAAKKPDLRVTGRRVLP